MDILKLVKKEESNMIQIRRDLHQIPELGLALPKTMKYLTDYLDKLGVSYKKLINGNALVVQINGTKGQGKCIAIRTDCDGLPIKEETGLEFASKNGNMHACGHDGHMTMALWAIKILNEHKNEFKGSIKIFFQPGEEYPGGALPMIEEGCMQNPKVDAIMGLHEGKFFPVKHGTIAVKHGALMASMDRFKINIIGKGSHGAQPHLSNDPILTACEIATSLQRIHSREQDPLENSVISICQIHGGSTQNIIPDEVFLEGTVRATNETLRKHIAKRIKEIATAIAGAYNCKAEIEYDFKYPVVMNDPKFTDFFVKSVKEILGENAIEYVEKPTMAGEDMSYFLNEAPGTFGMLTNSILKPDGTWHTQHTSEFDIDESTLYKGAVAFIATAINYLNGGI